MEFNSTSEFIKFIENKFGRKYTELGKHWSDHYEGRQKICIEIEDEEDFNFCKKELSGTFEVGKRGNGDRFYQNDGYIYDDETFEAVCAEMTANYSNFISNKGDEFSYYNEEMIEQMIQEDLEEEGTEEKTVREKYSWFEGNGYYSGKDVVLLDKNTLSSPGYDYDMKFWQVIFVVDLDSMISEEEDEEIDHDTDVLIKMGR